MLEELIRDVGAEPYGSWGIGAPLTRTAAALVGHGSTAASRRIAMLMAEHTLSEYRTLEALVQEAPGVPAELLDAVVPMCDELAREFQELADTSRT